MDLRQAAQEIVAVGVSGILAPCGRCRKLIVQIDQDNQNAKVVVSDDQYVLMHTLLPKH